MAIRTSIRTVTFKNPFILDCFDEVLPAGAYRVETDEELLESVSFPVYRRILTLIHLHTKSGNPGLTRTLPIDPKELEAALERDKATTEPPVDPNAGRTPRQGTMESRRDAADRQATEAGEDEGMIVRSGNAITALDERQIVS